MSLLFLGSCSSDGTGPGNGSDPGPELLATETIGVAGGEIGTADITITVPPGALDEEHILDLYADGPAGLPPCNSGPFLLDGLPEELGGPLTFRLRGDSEDEGDPLIYVQILEIVGAEGDSIWARYFLDAAEADGFLTAQWPDPDKAASSGREFTQASGPKVSGSPLLVFAPREQSKYCYPSEGNCHFRIHYPIDIAYQIGPLAEALEDAYQTFQNLGFSYWLARTGALEVWLPTVDVAFNHHTPGPAEYIVEGELTGEHTAVNAYYSASYVIYLDRMQADELATTCKMAQANFFQIVHEAQVFDSMGCQINRNFKKSISYWAERLFFTENNHSPGKCLGHLGYIGRGPKNSLDEFGDSYLLRQYTRSLPALLTYLWDDARYGKQPLLDMYAYFRLSGFIRDGFIQYLPAEPEVWWPAFFRELITGGIYDVLENEFLSLLSRTVTLNEAEMQIPITETYEDLSAHYFRIDLDFDEWNDGAFLALDIGDSGIDEDYLDIQVYGLNGSSLQYLASGASVRINGLADMKAAGQDLFVVMANAALDPPDMTAANVTLELSVENPVIPDVPDVFQLENGSIYFGMAAVTTTLEGEDCIGSGGSGTLMLRWQNLEGQWSGTTFTGSFEDTWTEGDITYQENESISVTMDAEGLNVVGWSCDKTLIATSDTESSTRTTEAEWTGAPIPVNASPGIWTIRYLEEGAEIGDWITVSVVKTYGDLDCTSTTVVDYWFDYSQLQVGFIQ